MFKTKEQIEEMGEQYAFYEVYGDNNSPDFKETVADYVAGATQMQKDLLESASEGVDEWFLNHNWKPEELMSRQAGCRVAWQAARLSSMKELQEKDQEIERLIKEVSDRNQYKVNQTYLDNVHAHYEGLEGKYQEAVKDIEWMTNKMLASFGDYTSTYRKAASIKTKYGLDKKEG